MTSDCYVYLHKDQEGVVRYVGFGRGERCLSRWKRKPDHAQFMDEMFLKEGLGFIEIVAKGLSEKEARSIETSLIKQHTPIYNRQQNGAANAGRGHENPRAIFSPEEVQKHRSLFSKWEGSMRAYHREYLSQFSFSAVRKMLAGLSYQTV